MRRWRRPDRRGSRTPHARWVPGPASSRFESARGFTLVEALVALLLLSTVLVAVATLFVQGGRVVAGARNQTEATRLASRILETMRAWPHGALYRSFGRDSADAAFQVETLTHPRARLWQAQIERRLPEGRGRIRVDPLGGPTFASSKGIRIRVTVEWKTGPELSADRSVTLPLVRF